MLTSHVAVVDDDPALGESVRYLLKTVGIPTIVFATARDFQAADRSEVGCLILDVRMPGMSGLELQDRLRKAGDDTPIIFLSGYADVPMVVRAIQGGAIDFLEKPFKAQALLDRVHEALQVADRRRAERADRSEYEARLGLLTRREREVLDLLVAGKTNKDIAAELNISRKTLDIHRAKVLHKMQADSAVQLVRMARTAGAK